MRRDSVCQRRMRQSCNGSKDGFGPGCDKFPGHIACSSLSKSEIVVPLVHKRETKLVLDIDSDKLADFDGTDQSYLEQIIGLIRQQNFSGKSRPQQSDCMRYQRRNNPDRLVIGQAMGFGAWQGRGKLREVFSATTKRASLRLEEGLPPTRHRILRRDGLSSAVWHYANRERESQAVAL